MCDSIEAYGILAMNRGMVCESHFRFLTTISELRGRDLFPSHHFCRERKKPFEQVKKPRGRRIEWYFFCFRKD